jgi:hypothetical protein
VVSEDAQYSDRCLILLEDLRHQGAKGGFSKALKKTLDNINVKEINKSIK